MIAALSPWAAVPELNAAFQAAWGAPPPLAGRPGSCCGSRLVAKPIMLTPLGGGRFALIVKESRKDDAHAAAGAVSVAYLQKRQGRWRALGNWPEIAWAGQSGGDNLTLEVRRDLGPAPLLFVRGFYVGQSQLNADATMVRLEANAPVTLGRIPTAGQFPMDGFRSLQPSYRYTSRVGQAKPPAVFAVRYEGVTGPPGRPPNQAFRRTATFIVRDGCLRATRAVALPDAPQPWTMGERCGPSRAAEFPRPDTSARTGPGPGGRD